MPLLEPATVAVRFGALAPSLKVQLRDHAISRKQLARLQKLSDAIVLLYLHSVVPQSVKVRAQDRLFQQICLACADAAVPRKRGRPPAKKLATGT